MHESEWGALILALVLITFFSGYLQGYKWGVKDERDKVKRALNSRYGKFAPDVETMI